MAARDYFDHTATVWRGTEGKVAGEVVLTWAAVETGILCGVDNNRGLREDRGAGEIGEGFWMVYVDADADVRPRTPGLRTIDIVEITAGPNAPLTLNVEERDVPFRAVHAELRCTASTQVPA